ncbi:MucR family transcriptional regulator [Candidatus Entotheonella palauensis]|uniref:MucR family transcriptional regulator n=1 Tax=Candidatus Entotheonella palauensis TaxID=93172 RepID=UPI000B7F8C72|nr:MucR family transcriptional regulator [Candidatus Entotheonella palauensis]
MAKSLVEMCAEIVAAQAGHTRLTSEEIGDSLRQVFWTLQDVQRTGQETEVEESVSRDPQSSIQRNQVICLECGKSFKLLSNRHLALHNLTPREYKQKHGIRMTQALSARTLSQRRRKLAKELGMGKQLAEWRAERKHRPAG